jgi:hypothetical protein
MTMTYLSDPGWLWLAKSAGAIAGSAISLALPQGRREAAVRFAVGVACGLVFGGTVGLKIAAELGIEELINVTEMTMMGAAAASLCAWWALGFVKRFFEGNRFGRWIDQRRKRSGAHDS